jgi:hypothetical protein
MRVRRWMMMRRRRRRMTMIRKMGSRFIVG